MVIMGNPLGDMNAIDTLVKLRVSIDAQDDEGWTCLHWAAYHNNVGGVEKLMETVGSVPVLKLLTVKNKEGLTALEVAKKNGQLNFENWLQATVK